MAISTINSSDNGANSLTKINDNFTELNDNLADLDTAKADIASPAFTGTVTLPTGTVAVTQSASDNSTKIATTAYVDALSIQLPAVTTSFPLPLTPLNATITEQFTLSVNTTMYAGMVSIPARITANKISIFTVSTITTPGTLDITLYSEDGQTQIFSVTTGTISAGSTIYTTALSSVLIPAGNYYITCNSNGTFNGDIAFYKMNTGTSFATTELRNGITSEPILNGTVSITAGTPPATITPTTITSVDKTTLVFRLDN